MDSVAQFSVAVPGSNISAVAIPQAYSSATAISDHNVSSVAVPENYSSAIAVSWRGPTGPGGPVGPPGSSAVVIQAPNSESFVIKAGQPVFLHGDMGGGCRLAKADDLGTVAVGIVLANTDPAGFANILLLGLMVSSDWTSPTGGTQFLTEGVSYFLSQGANGIITPVPPDGTSQICQYLGIAVSPTTFFVQIDRPVVV
jgi:hypothetical protein